MKKRARLRNLSFDEVSLVPSGDDPMAEVIIAKTDKTQPTAEGEPTLKVNATNQEDAPMADPISKDDLPAEVAEYIERIEIENTEMAEAIEELTDIDAELAKLEEEDPEEAVLAKADPAIRELVEKAQAEAEEAQAVAKAERDARIHRELVEKAETLGSLPGSSDSLVTILKALDELDEETATAVEELLTAANAQIEAGSLFDEMGSAVAKVSEPIEAQAEAIRKDNPEMTAEDAMVAAIDANMTFAQLLLGAGGADTRCCCIIGNELPCLGGAGARDGGGGFKICAVDAPGGGGISAKMPGAGCDPPTPPPARDSSCWSILGCAWRIASSISACVRPFLMRKFLRS